MFENKFDYDAQIVKGVWCIEISTAAQSGMAQNVVSGVFIGLWFDDNELMDFYGVKELPDIVVEGVRELGFAVDEEEFA